MSLQGEIDNLFVYAMKGQWDEVLRIYKKSPEAQKTKITKSEDTALHVAVSVGQTDTAVELVAVSQEGILEMKNARGNSALHIAAALGNLLVCKSMVSRNLNLITIRNDKGETPLFLAALHGKRDAFIYLHSLSKDEYLVRRNDGDTVLHAAITGEYFKLALNIIHCHPSLADAINENGLSPLHILASKPNAFHSSTRLGLFDRIIYHCLVVDEFEEETHDVEAYIAKKSKKGKETLDRLHLNQSVSQVHKRRKEGDETVDEENPHQQSGSIQVATPGVDSYAVSSESKGATEEPSFASSSRLSHAKGNEEQENKTVGEESPQKTSSSQGDNQRSESRQFPSNYDKIVLFLKLLMKALLIILGIGILRIKKIQRKKELHMWAKRAMNELIKYTTSYKFYDNTGLYPGEVKEEFLIPNDLMTDPGKKLTSDSSFKSDQKQRSDQNEIGKQHTPILIAAKMGVTEMVEKILDEFPVAIQDLDSDNKNVVLLAVENRQSQVYNHLLHRKILKESVFRQLDNEGNSALHLAAQCKEQRPWLIPGVALQIQWEIKWYKFVKHSMPPQFFPRYNTKHETPKEVFITSHKDLIKEGGKWLTKTSESCSVVAALIATVAFTTSATVPGGVDQNTGIPLLKGKFAFDAFSISSLIALCFSITALVFFLSILTSRYDEKDFAMDLPRKLLFGLTSLFASIASVLVSFCDGHIFILSHKLKYVAYPLYAALCFPITYFAFAQLSLYFDLCWAIFKKVPQRSNKAFLH
ncbi:Transmembrane protein [Trema orientale]|uniref:Transmembrane protein n=1 Tax=Trema orientale TaxID=63057 RepID=A0A2P5F403_TREOI|nr:Transmembrane protein [Trema orientale]